MDRLVLGGVGRRAIAVPLNAWWTRPELEYGLADSGATVLIADGERAKRLSGAGIPTIVARGSGLEGVRHLTDVLGEVRADVTLPPAEIGPEDPATIFYTSGTTGRSKGALGSHRNLGQAPMSVAYAILRSAALAGKDPVASAGERRITLLTVPLFHVTGCFAVLMPTMFTGGEVVLMYKWDAGRALGLIEREKVTVMSGVPTNAWQLLSHPSFGEHDISSLRGISYGGAPAPPKLLERINELLPDRTPANGYGMTETTALAIFNSGQDYVARPESIGLPMAVVDVRICDPLGNELPVGEVGELCLRGPSGSTRRSSPATRAARSSRPGSGDRSSAPRRPVRARPDDGMTGGFRESARSSGRASHDVIIVCSAIREPAKIAVRGRKFRSIVPGPGPPPAAGPEPAARIT